MAAEIGKAREWEGGRLGTGKSWSWSRDWEPSIALQIWGGDGVVVPEAGLRLRVGPEGGIPTTTQPPEKEGDWLGSNW